MQKINDNGEDEPGYYRPKTKKFKGFISQLRIYRCIFTGQIDRVPIEPGIYKSGNPNSKSPIIVTANYEYTYIKLMRDLQGIDAWVLCLDSNGINVWCAARGDDFGNKQLLEAIEATDIITFERTIHITNSPSHHMIATLFKTINESKIAIIGIKKIFRNKKVVCVVPARTR